jgi:hypothetical protein
MWKTWRAPLLARRRLINVIAAFEFSIPAMPRHDIWLRITVEHEALTVSGRMAVPGDTSRASIGAAGRSRSTAVPLV